MGLQVVMKDGVCQPIIICDHCQMPICGKGFIGWQVDGSGPVFLHKRCKRLVPDWLFFCCYDLTEWLSRLHKSRREVRRAWKRVRKEFVSSW